MIAEDFEKALAQLAPNESSYIVIATRGHRDDMRVLRWAVQTPARYIGMIGSKRKVITVFRELVQEGLKPELFDRVYSPVGLDIGAITPEEIAVSIVAELIGLRRHAERPLPHMSWFHSARHAADAGEEETGADDSCNPKRTGWVKRARTAAEGAARILFGDPGRHDLKSCPDTNASCLLHGKARLSLRKHERARPEFAE